MIIISVGSRRHLDILIVRLAEEVHEEVGFIGQCKRRRLRNILGFILPPLFYGKLQASRGYWSAPGPRFRRNAELAALALVFVFGLAFLYLSTSSFVYAIIEFNSR